MPKLLLPLEAADAFRVNVRTLRNWRNKGIIRAIQIGGCVRYDAAEIERVLQPSGPEPTKADG